MFRSLALVVVGSDAARIDHHLNFETNATADKGGLIKVMDGSKCLAVYGGNYKADGVTIFAENCKPGAAHQTWKHEKGALKNVAAPGKCLDIFENKCSNGQNLILWKCNGQRNQQFQFIGKNLKSSKCSKCLDVDQASNIKNVLLWSCGVGKQNQKMDWAAEFSLAEQEETEVLLSGFPEGTLVTHKKMNCEGVVVQGKGKNKVCYEITGGAGKKCAKMANGKAKCVGAKAAPKQLSILAPATTTTTKAPYTYDGPLHGVSDQREGQPVHLVKDGEKCEGTLKSVNEGCCTGIGGICAACNGGEDTCFPWKQVKNSVFQTPEINSAGCEFQFKRDVGGCEAPETIVLQSGACKDWCAKEFPSEADDSDADE